MNHFQSARLSTLEPRAQLQIAATDAAGMLWGHSNPVELYRWIAQRNDLLQTIAGAFPGDGRLHRRPLAS